MTAQIYSMNNGTQIAYQHANSRAINAGGEWRCETNKGGVWIPAANRWLNIVRRTQKALA